MAALTRGGIRSAPAAIVPRKDRQAKGAAKEEAGIAELENKDGETFSQLAWDYANENGCMPYEELICILGEFHGRAAIED